MPVTSMVSRTRPLARCSTAATLPVKLRRHLAAEHFCAGAPGFGLGEQATEDAEQRSDQRHMDGRPRPAQESDGAKAAGAGSERQETGLVAERKIDQRAHRQEHRRDDEGDAAVEFGRTAKWTA